MLCVITFSVYDPGRKEDSMARVKLNPALASFLGEMGEMVFKMRHGKIYVSRKTEPKPRESTRAQKAIQDRFRLATQHAKRVMADPAESAPYAKAAEQKERSMQNLIIADFLNAPSVDSIDVTAYAGQPGNRIRIEASDDFDVVAVDVVLSTASGEPVEQGSAALTAMKWGVWIYTATAAVPPGLEVVVEATAADRPGNRTARKISTSV